MRVHFYKQKNIVFFLDNMIMFSMLHVGFHFSSFDHTDWKRCKHNHNLELDK